MLGGSGTRAATWCLLFAAAIVPLAEGQSARCACDAARPQTLENRECSLCKEAEASKSAVFFLKDINPRKPNRLLALPKTHAPGAHNLSDLSPEVRTALWTQAIAKARELWGEDWAIALNGGETRTQCHTHLHIGRLLDGMETPLFVVVDQPSKIPAPEDGSGLWVHPAGKAYHVHTGEQLTEPVIMR